MDYEQFTKAIVLGIFLMGLLGLSYKFLGRGSLRLLPLAMLTFIAVLGVAAFALIYKDQGKVEFISKDEQRAIDMKKQNCKQTAFVQGKSSIGTGVGVATGKDLKPVVGAVMNSEQDSYVYSCDGGMQYTLNYDIKKYDKT